MRSPKILRNSLQNFHYFTSYKNRPKNRYLCAFFIFLVSLVLFLKICWPVILCLVWKLYFIYRITNIFRLTTKLSVIYICFCIFKSLFAFLLVSSFSIFSACTLLTFHYHFSFVGQHIKITSQWRIRIFHLPLNIYRILV